MVPMMYEINFVLVRSVQVVRKERRQGSPDEIFFG